MNRARLGIAALAVLIGLAGSPGQEKEKPGTEPRVKEPRPPAKYDLTIRYRIRADRDERVRQFRVLEKYLESLGFDDARKNDPDRDLEILDPTAEFFSGTIPSGKVLDVLADPRVQNVLFAPAGFTYPDAPDKPVAIRVSIRGGLLPAQQQQFHLQALIQLEKLGFRENIGYDTRGYTLLRGSIPYKNLDRLTKDLRGEPSGWLLPDTPRDQLPRPFADRNPVRWVEVLPITDFPPAYVPPPILPIQNKFTPDLRAVMVNPAMKEVPLRVVVLFSEPVDDRLEALRTRLVASYGPTPKRNPDGTAAGGLTEGASLDGAVGNLASIRFDRPADLERFAIEPNVLGIRLPHPAAETAAPIPGGTQPAPAREVLQGSQAANLQEKGYTGTGVKVVLFGSDFTGAEKLAGDGLPPRTTVIDLTTELNPEIVSSPPDPTRAGIGLATARALALAAPDAELVLVRVDPGAIFQLFGVLRVARGDTTYSPAMRSRLIEITTRAAELSRRKDAAVAEYRAAFEDLADDEPTKERRKRARDILTAVIADQAVLTRRIERFNAFQKSMTENLTGARVFVNTLVWESGYPLDSMSLLSQTLERLTVPLPPRIVRRPGDPAAAPKPAPVWVQAASAAGPAVWGGQFLDLNKDGTMEFVRPETILPPEHWSPDLNFLGVRSPAGATTPEVPAATRVRFTMQWREPLDPNFPNVGLPLYPIVLRVFRQLDPLGDKRPSDELAEVARSVGGPYPIAVTRTDVVYEQILEFAPAEAGRYGLMISLGYQPDPALPALRREAEVNPRLVVETLSPIPGNGRVVFRSFTNPAAGVGIPGDSLGAITIGVPVPGELVGGGTGLLLRAKPDLFGPDSADAGGPAFRGPGVAAGFLGGLATDLVQAGASGANVFLSSGFQPGKMAVVPDAWLRYLKPLPKPQK